MKLMKYSIILSLLFIGSLHLAQAQKLAEAKASYASGDLENARFVLQEALIELDEIIGKEILALLPEELGDMKAILDEDENVATAAGFTGLYILRKYANADESQTLELTIMNDSPFMAMVSGFMTSPIGGMVPGRKRIKIDGYKTMVEKVQDADPTEYNFFLPFDQSLLTMNFKGVNSETDVTNMANKIPVGEIVAISK